MTAYSKNGCGYKILTRLAEGTAFSEEFHDLGRNRRDVHFTVNTLSRDGLIEVTKAGYEITETGRAKLDELNGIGAKVFGMRAAG
jgi:Mn-dependent DtxR family transcriptional regulator